MIKSGLKTTSLPNKPAPPRFLELEKLVTPISKDTFFRWSCNGVPHLLVELGRGVIYSLCYFEKSKSWRVFFPYARYDNPQTKRDFQSVDDMLKFLKKHQPRKVTNGN